MYLFYFINLDGWRCWWTDFVPEAIHKLVAIKLLMLGLIYTGGKKFGILKLILLSLINK